MNKLDNIVCQVEITASPERVWQVMTGPGLVEEWLGCMGFEAKLGVVFYMQPDGAKRAAGDVSGATHCELEALEPPSLMRFSWYMPGTPKTHVELRAEPAGGAVRVSLVHSGWDQFEPDQVRAIRDMLDGGWRSFVLPGLKRVAEARGRD
ncbi:MAG: SRPBCC domain-containing protein [Proteobacteria bacterium]|nr:SRPBCC domain-containing protein [Pseudomonadota bacterium]